MLTTQSETYSCPKAKCQATAPLGRACPAPLPRPPPPPEPEQPPITPTAATELPGPSAPLRPGTHTSHPSPGQRPGNPSPCRHRTGPGTTCPTAHCPHNTSAEPTPQRPAAHGGAGQPPGTANETAGRRPRCTPGGTPAPPWCLPGNVVLAAGYLGKGVPRTSWRGQRRLPFGGIYQPIMVINVVIIMCKYGAINAVPHAATLKSQHCRLQVPQQREATDDVVLGQGGCGWKTGSRSNLKDRRTCSCVLIPGLCSVQ